MCSNHKTFVEEAKIDGAETRRRGRRNQTVCKCQKGKKMFNKFVINWNDFNFLYLQTFELRSYILTLSVH